MCKEWNQPEMCHSKECFIISEFLALKKITVKHLGSLQKWKCDDCTDKIKKRDTIAYNIVTKYCKSVGLLNMNIELNHKYQIELNWIESQLYPWCQGMQGTAEIKMMKILENMNSK